MTIEFTWDPAKAASNQMKHRVSFATATSVFLDAQRLMEVDTGDHDEFRWNTIGRTDEGDVIVMVVHTDWEEDGIEIIRIISARRATTNERKRYEQNRLSFYT
jgi:uncharacterized protein